MNSYSNSYPLVSREQSRRSSFRFADPSKKNFDHSLSTSYSTDEYGAVWLNPLISGVSQSDLFMLRNPLKAVLTIDGGTKKVLTCNEIACRLFDVEQSELVGRHFGEFFQNLRDRSEIRPTTADRVLAPDHQHMQDVYGKVTEICDKNGLVIPVAVWVRHILQGSVDRWLIVLEPVEKLSASCVANQQVIFYLLNNFYQFV